MMIKCHFPGGFSPVVGGEFPACAGVTRVNLDLVGAYAVSDTGL